MGKWNYIPDPDASTAILGAMYGTKNNRKIFEYFSENSGTPGDALESGLDMPQTSLYRSIGELINMGILKQDGVLKNDGREAARYTSAFKKISIEFGSDGMEMKIETSGSREGRAMVSGEWARPVIGGLTEAYGAPCGHVKSGGKDFYVIRTSEFDSRKWKPSDSV